jgi:uncharacterized protein (DUF2236 family)
MRRAVAIPDRPVMSNVFRVVSWISTCLLRERMREQFALQWITGHHSCPDNIKILSRLFFTPGSAALRKRLQAHWRPRRVTRNATRMTHAFRGENRLNLCLEKFKIQRRRGGRLLCKQHRDHRH